MARDDQSKSSMSALSRYHVPIWGYGSYLQHHMAVRSGLANPSCAIVRCFVLTH
jgi:hypothetical protein